MTTKSLSHKSEKNMSSFTRIARTLATAFSMLRGAVAIVCQTNYPVKATQLVRPNNEFDRTRAPPKDLPRTIP